MRQWMMIFALAVALVLSAGSLIGDKVAAGPSEIGCCICADCSSQNATTMGIDAEGAVCLGATGPCETVCLKAGCQVNQFENATCSDISLAPLCSPGGIAPAPAMSSLGLLALALLLVSFGVFYLHDRRA